MSEEKRGEWAGTIDGGESASSEPPVRSWITMCNDGRGWSKTHCAHSLRDPDRACEAGSCRAVAITSRQGGDRRPRGNRPCSPGNQERTEGSSGTAELKRGNRMQNQETNNESQYITIFSVSWPHNCNPHNRSQVTRISGSAVPQSWISPVLRGRRGELWVNGSVS